MSDLHTLMTAYQECKGQVHKNNILRMIADEATNLITLDRITTITSTIERDKVEDYKLAESISFDEIVKIFQKDNPGVDATLSGPAVITDLGMFVYKVEGDGIVGDWKLWVVPATKVYKR